MRVKRRRKVLRIVAVVRANMRVRVLGWGLEVEMERMEFLGAEMNGKRWMTEGVRKECVYVCVCVLVVMADYNTMLLFAGAVVDVVWFDSGENDVSGFLQ